MLALLIQAARRRQRSHEPLEPSSSSSSPLPRLDKTQDKTRALRRHFTRANTNNKLSSGQLMIAARHTLHIVPPGDSSARDSPSSRNTITSSCWSASSFEAPRAQHTNPVASVCVLIVLLFLSTLVGPRPRASERPRNRTRARFLLRNNSRRSRALIHQRRPGGLKIVAAYAIPRNWPTSTINWNLLKHSSGSYWAHRIRAPPDEREREVYGS